jgi:hypothetical protein
MKEPKIQFVVQPKKGTPFQFVIDKTDLLAWLEKPGKPIYLDDKMAIKDKKFCFMTIFEVRDETG